MTDRDRVAVVTGGTGFVGSHLVDALLESGRRVRCVVRDLERIRWLEGRAVELVEGDVTDGDLSATFRDAEVVFHFAGLTRGPPGELDRVNRAGTGAVARACLALDPIPALIFCSSQAAAGPATSGHPRREDDPPAPISPYGRSKLAAEQEIRRLADRLPATILRPSAVYGPRDRDTLPFFQLARKGIVPVPGWRRRQLQVVYVRDVAAAALRAAERPGARGRTYFIADPQILTWPELAKAIGTALDRRVVAVPVPGPLIRLAGRVGDALGVGAEAGRLDRRRARDLTVRAWTCDTTRARADLDWEPEHGLERGLRETADWYRERGWL